MRDLWSLLEGRQEEGKEIQQWYFPLVQRSLWKWQGNLWGKRIFRHKPKVVVHIARGCLPEKVLKSCRHRQETNSCDSSRHEKDAYRRRWFRLQQWGGMPGVASGVVNVSSCISHSLVRRHAGVVGYSFSWPNSSSTCHVLQDYEGRTFVVKGT